MADLCPRCRKYVNTNEQKISLADGVHATYFCEECGMTIKSNIEPKNIFAEEHKESPDEQDKRIIE